LRGSPALHDPLRAIMAPVVWGPDSRALHDPLRAIMAPVV
jgi:hypothetical protein